MPPRPNLFIVGAAKAGTTSLYHYLRQHPDIFMSPVKEPHFFSQVRPDPAQRTFMTIVSDEQAYAELFREATDERFVGEASPSYLWDTETPGRIRESSPDARIIILLREPVSRAHSHYLMDVREGRQWLSFYDALKTDYARQRKGWGISHLYVELGQYCEQVSRYLQHFGPERVLVLFFEALAGDPRATLEDVLGFLGTDLTALDGIHYDKLNPYAAPRSNLSRRVLGTNRWRGLRQRLPDWLKRFARSRLLLRQEEKPQLDARAVAFLQEIYEPDRTCLEDLLQRPLPW